MWKQCLKFSWVFSNSQSESEVKKLLHAYSFGKLSRTFLFLLSTDSWNEVCFSWMTSEHSKFYQINLSHWPTVSQYLSLMNVSNYLITTVTVYHINLHTVTSYRHSCVSPHCLLTFSSQMYLELLHLCLFVNLQLCTITEYNQAPPLGTFREIIQMKLLGKNTSVVD